jgi:tetratricopeptide (TPR) repeat protein
MVDACTLLGNIYSETKNSDEASKYYQKALESIDDTTLPEGLSELYFKYALMCDENGDTVNAFEYYNKCINLNENSPFKALAYSNIGSCYMENENYSDAEACFLKAYNLEKNNNNYEGIYYTASNLAKIYIKSNPDKALEYMKEAKQSAEFINEDFYVLEATIALGDYYYDHKDMTKNAATEYFGALKIAKNYGDMIDVKKIEERIQDMKLRMDSNIFEKIEEQYG